MRSERVEETRTSKSIVVGSDGSAQVSIALRQRLNEAVEELEVVRREQQELQVRFEVMEKDYAIAKSDREWGACIADVVHLVDKDQLEALSCEYYGCRADCSPPRECQI